jgi:hypothetical protein
MAENEIKKYVDKGCELGDEPEDEVTKIIKKLLELMNWSIDDINPQASVQSINGKVRADFLIDDGENKFIIELKSPTVPLADERARGQLRAYLLLHNVPYGVLYNGQELLLMKKGTDEPVFEWNCSEDKEDISIFLNFSKGVYPNNIEKFISERQERVKLKAVLSENDEKIKNSVSEMIASDFGMPLETVKANISIRLGVTSSGVATGKFSALVPKISRKELTSKGDGLVVICPSDVKGPAWVKKYKAWRSVKISRDPIYFALYVGWPESKVLYFGEIEKIIDVESPDITKKYDQPQVSHEEYGKKVIILKPETIRELIDPIEASKGKWSAIRGVRYSSLINFINAKTIEDLSVDE